MLATENVVPMLTALIQRLFALLPLGQWGRVLSAGLRWGRGLLSGRSPEGLYEVLDYESRLELLDIRGRKAVLYKRERVRFLQNDSIAYQDKAWGVGQIFADYKCSPGVAVDRYREGHRWQVLIALRASKKRGDIEEFHIQRTIRNGFRQSAEDFQTDVDHQTHRLTLRIVFPRKRLPKQVSILQQNAARTQVLGSEQRQTLPDGRQQYTWRVVKPRRYEAYILQWVW